MVKETEKKIDDYYSNIKKDNSDSSSKSQIKWKLKIKPKSKPKIKKVIKDTTEASNTKEQKKEVSVNKWAQKPKKRIISNSFSDPVKPNGYNKEKKENKKTTENKNNWNRQSNNKYSNHKWTQKSSYVKKDYNKNDNKKNDNSNNGSLSSTVWVARSSWNKNQKVFTDNKKANSNKFSINKQPKRSSLGWYKRSNKYKGSYEDDTSFTRSNKMKNIVKEETKIEDIKQNLIDRSWETIVIPDVLTLKEFSEKIWVALPLLMAEFMKNWMMITLNAKVDFDTASIISEAFNIKLEKDNSGWISVEDIISWDMSELLKEEDESKLSKRAPIISIMWHVDHGKTSLLDSIRNAKIADWEAWWITQSIWAYQVDHNWEKITFLDTPWHEAFTVMRARWAKSTDIAILVVAADEWVKPQTIESINHAKEADIPVIVAINKMDKEWANPDHVMWQLAEHWLTSEKWGWDTPMIPVSAKTWDWVDDLLEIILLVAEMQELKANRNRAWVATVIESHLDTKLWAVSTVLINTWEIKIWDAIVCKNSFWKIKVLKNYAFKNIKYAWPSEPVMVIWLDSVVDWWDLMQVVSWVDVARTKAAEFDEIMKAKAMSSMTGLDLIMSKIQSWSLKTLKIVVKADTNWSLEAIKWWLQKLSTSETNISIVHSWVGNITEWDILMCQWSSAILISFNTDIASSAKSILEKSWVEYISSKIIYHITERVEKIVSWMLDPKEVEVNLCNALVWWIFFDDKKFMILWLKIKEEWETIENNTLVRVIRKNKVVWKWKIESLKQWVEEVKKLEWPIECWVKFVWDVKVEENDILEIYKVEVHK